MWSIRNFGRYKDKMSLPEVVLHDPDYFFWASDTCAFHRRGFPEAGGLAEKARYIKIPKPDGEGWGVLYDFEPDTKIFNGFELVQGPRAVELLGEQYMWDRPKHLDLSVVCRLKRHDKIGNERLLRDFKLCYFGDQNTNLSREKCEAFFDCDANFDEPPNLSRFFRRTSEEVCETEMRYERETKNSCKQPLIEKMNFGKEAHEGEV
jgi:hypothetical protein